MKLLICGDLHIRSTPPENRIDNYFESQKNKIHWILNLAKENNATVLLPGDVFDNYRQPNYILEYYIFLFKLIKMPIITVAGQHDLKYHSINKEDTALAVLDASDALLLINNEIVGEGLDIYGASFGEKIPKIENPKEFNILLTHRMIIHSDKIWNAQEDFDYAENLLRKHPFDLIVSGDNHHFFIANQGNRYLINCGSLMRSTIAQLNHIPKVVLFDIDTRTYEIYNIPIEPISEVFNLNKIKEKKEKIERFDAFVKGLNESKNMTFSFQDCLNDYIKENEISEEIQQIIMEAM